MATQIKKIAILGFGKEGQSLLAFLRKNREYRNAKICVCDRNQNLEVPRAPNIEWRLGTHYLKNLDRFDVLFRSPGIPFLSAKIQRAKKAGVEVLSATKLFFSLVPRKKIIGVTGSKGKGTTSTLLAKILAKAGFRVVLAGNIGKPMLDAIEAAQRADYAILELSSFQLQDLDISPSIAIVLDIFPEHLDHHKSIAEYQNAKANIGKFQKKSDAIFYFSDNAGSQKIARQSPAKKIAIRPIEKGVKKNFEMAAAIAKFLKCPPRAIQTSIADFHGLPHRLELIRTIYPHSNTLKNTAINFWNDSAATNPEAAAAAIRSFDNPLILIAGGKNKGLDYAPLARAIRASKNVKMAILYGENKEKIKRTITTNNKKLATKSVGTLASGIKIAYQFSKKLINSPTHRMITILFSPASASFDQFINYEERGEKFAEIVRRIKEK